MSVISFVMYSALSLNFVLGNCALEKLSINSIIIIIINIIINYIYIYIIQIIQESKNPRIQGHFFGRRVLSIFINHPRQPVIIGNALERMILETLSLYIYIIYIINYYHHDPQQCDIFPWLFVAACLIFDHCQLHHHHHCLESVSHSASLVP